MSAYGTYDMAGNVREWCLNASTLGERFILGGGWIAEAILDAHADAVLVVSIAHFGTCTIAQMKEYLAGRGIPVRQ